MALFYPTAPTTLIAAWNNRHSFQANPLVQRFSGIEDRGTAFGINAIDHTWSLDIKVVGFEKYWILDDFLRERDGKPFYLDYDENGVTDGLYRTASHQWTWESANIWGLSIELTEVNR
jgi:phage-related protein